MQIDRAIRDARRNNIRRDIVSTTSHALAVHLKKAISGADSRLASPAGRERQIKRANADSNIDIRAGLIDEPRSDPNGLERLIGRSDLLSINFLDRGKRAAAAVCRIKVPSIGGAWYGTGFLVGPRLLVTNNHVLSDADEASQCEAEFGYEHDADGVLQNPVSFNLRPHEIFYTNPDLDITFVAVTPLSDQGVALDRYGRLPLLPLRGKSVDGEWVTIIQHPGSKPKQIAIRSTQIVNLEPSVAKTLNVEQFIHYSTDTEPGSSGAPVLNDQWQVLAVHHKAVPDPQTKSAKLTADPIWIANEGVRVSAIFSLLQSDRLNNPQADLVLDRLGMSLGLLPLPDGTEREELMFEADRKPLPLSRWANVKGYDPAFLGAGPKIDLATICARKVAKKEVAPLLGKPSKYELTYRHFSIVIHEKRKFALLTAVNIDGAKLARPAARKDTWRRDPRIADKYQPAGNFYERNKGHDPIPFSRGHQVRLFDPCWVASKGKAADAEIEHCMEDTFHYTNAAPQFQKYNDTDWGNLEDYLLDKAQTTEKKLTVFTGPIYRKDDPIYGEGRTDGPWQIPLRFWKIAVLRKSETKVAAAAFVVGQIEYVRALYEAKVFSGLTPYSVEDMKKRHIQTTIAAISEETGLDFSVLEEFDAHGSLEATRQTRLISNFADIMI
jgi:endonuclease G, mitochondrial